ncbi:MAG TPA: DUF2953 domain-containing protein [Clostridia bacterium]|nr:DUF2953 domain-containing protein [Clostridia bacterium]
MALFILFEVLIFIVVGLLIPMRLRVSACVDTFRPSFSAELDFFYRLFKLRINGFLNCSPLFHAELWLSVNGKPYKRISAEPKKKKPRHRRPGATNTILRAVLRGGTAETLRVRCKVGIAEDAYHTVLVCGVLRIFFNALMALFHLKSAAVSVTPDFKAPVFWLKVEGILTIHSTQIIGAVLERGLKRQRKKHKEGNQNVASH